MSGLLRAPRVLQLMAALLPSPFIFAQELHVVPVFHQIPSTGAAFQSSNTFSIDRINGCTYVPITQVAGAVNGQLHWRPVTHSVELTVRGKKMSFGWNSSYVHMSGTRFRLEQPTVKNDEGFWVPISFFSGGDFFSVVGSRLEWKEKPVAPAVHAHPAKARMPAPRLNPRTVPVLPPIPTAPILVAAPPVTIRAARAVRRIVIDPGHGGKDPGTVGMRGVEEKMLNLALAQALGQLLREQYGYEVLLTRTDDTFIPLAQRTRIANQANADLFISIHCNASLSSRLHGFEVYFLSEKSSDAHADSVARAENAPLALEDREARMPGQLKALLRSLVKNANINDSSMLGSLLDHQVNYRLKTSSRGVQQANFYVLRGAEMPAVLIESGFLSNAKEEQSLEDADFRQHLMEDVAKAVGSYDQRKQGERR